MLYQLSYLSGSLHDRENRATVNGSGEAMRIDSGNLNYRLSARAAAGCVVLRRSCFAGGWRVHSAVAGGYA